MSNETKNQQYVLGPNHFNLGVLFHSYAIKSSKLVCCTCAQNSVSAARPAFSRTAPPAEGELDQRKQGKRSERGLGDGVFRWPGLTDSDLGGRSCA